MKSPSTAEMIVNPSFCSVSLKLATLANQDASDQEAYPAKLVETTIIITSALSFLDLFLRCQENDDDDDNE